MLTFEADTREVSTLLLGLDLFDCYCSDRLLPIL